jgi:hypothetical protein
MQARQIEVSFVKYRSISSNLQIGSLIDAGAETFIKYSEQKYSAY